MPSASRKINIPVKPVVATKGSVTKPRAVQVPAPTVKAKPAPVVVAKPKVERAPKTTRVEHSVTTLYAGASPGLNKRKSATKLDLSIAGTNPDYIRSERSELVAETIKKEYGNKPFPRANLDAGIAKHLLIKGHIEAVSGDGGESTVLRFTRQGMSYHRKTA